MLREFSDAHGITYPLLADVGSRVITELGILNTTIEAERAAYGRGMEERHRNLPYPGTFVLDENGVVVDRHFEKSHRIRPTTRSLLGPLDVDMPPEVVADAAAQGVAVRATCDNRTVSANQLQTITIEIALEDDAHIYVDPVPDGYTTLTATIDGPDELRSRHPESPKGEPFEVTGLPEEFFVVDGNMTLEGAFYMLSGRDTAGDEAQEVTVEVNLAFQVCTSETCFMPERITLPLTFELVPNPAYESVGAASLRPLVMRRLDETARTFDDLAARVRSSLESHVVTDEAIQAMLDDLVDDGLVVGDGDLWVSAAKA